MKLKRKKVGDRVYDLYDRETGKHIANAAMTGEWGRDNYPWEYSLADGVEFNDPEGIVAKPRSTGSLATLAEIVDYIESWATHYGFKGD